MYQIYFYKDRKGVEPVAEYLQELSQKNGKDARIKLNKIRDCVKSLSMYGTYVGEPVVKHLDGEIWELRPFGKSHIICCLDRQKFCIVAPFCEKNPKNTQKRNRNSPTPLARF